MTRAAAQQGKAEAGVHIRPQPTECAQDTPHAAPHLGDDAVSLDKRERAQTDAANASKHRCFVHNENVRQGLNGPAK